MTAVSTDFAPPFKLIAPYFVLGIAFFLFSVLLLFGIDVSNLTNMDTQALAWVHLFLLGFVMMIIFGAMAQLIPVVLEVGHSKVNLYYLIYPLLAIGTLLMGFGFIQSTSLLPYGGAIVLIALLIFILETALTIIKVKQISFVIGTILIANIFLFLGLIFGIIMALGYAGNITIDILSLLQAHIYLVLIGYVGITIIGMSMILLPMFWLSHNFSWTPVKLSVFLITLGVILVTLTSVFEQSLLKDTSYILTAIGSFCYIYQVYLIFKTKVRMERDIYFKSMISSFASLVFAMLLGIFYLFFPSSTLLLSIGWVIFLGFITPMITGHLYKIIPFLVWFDKFSPLVGKQKVPMLSEMVPVKSANFQLFFTFIGVTLSTLGIIFRDNNIFNAGVSFLFVGTVFITKDLIYMMKFKG